MIYLVIFLVVFLLLAFCKVPVPFAMGIGAIVTMIYAGGSTAAIPTSMFHQRIYIPCYSGIHLRRRPDVCSRYFCSYHEIR